MSEEAQGQVISKVDDTRFMVRRARLAYPSLVEHNEYAGKSTGKFVATLLIPKTPNILKPIEAFIHEELKARKMRVHPNNYFYIDGDQTEYPGYAGHWALKTSSKLRPRLVNGRRDPMPPEEFYAGCYVNGIIQPWIQRNQHDKRVNCNINGLQFVDDGEPLVEGLPADAADFPEMEDQGGNDPFDEEGGF